ncbi:MAG TPA: tetratricopeptide repeat protein [Treponemataceae bacterium]|nr:tetratricopeptide repeat protein [Treponemataceae bacterium]
MADTLQKGIHLYKNNKFRESLTVLLSLQPPENDVDALEIAYYTGLSYAQLQRYDDALLYLEQFVTSTDDEQRLEQCRLSLAIIYSITGRKRLAELEIKELVENGYDSCEVYCARAFINWEQGNIQDAIDDYEKALELNSDSPTALNGLGYVLACQDRDLTRALSLCKRAVDILPDSAACLDSLGWVYYKLGLNKEAKIYITRARSFNSHNKEIAEHYALVLEQESM